MEELSLREFYERWSAANLPKIVINDNSGLIEALKMLLTDLSMVYENSIRISVNGDNVYFLSLEEDEDERGPVVRFPEGLEPEGKPLTGDQFVRYFSCFEIEGVAKYLCIQIGCSLGKGSINRILGRGETSKVYAITIDGDEYALKEIDIQEFPEELTITQRASDFGISPRIIKSARCERKDVMLTEKMDGSVAGMNPSVEELTHIVIEIYKLMKKLEKAGIVHKDLHVGNIMWKKVNAGFEYKIIDYQMAEFGQSNTEDLFKRFILMIGLGEIDPRVENYDPAKYFDTPVYTFLPGCNVDPTLTFAQRRAVLKGIEQIGMTHIFESDGNRKTSSFENFEEQKRYITPDKETKRSLKIRFNELVKIGLLSLPDGLRIDPKWYYAYLRNNNLEPLLRRLCGKMYGIYFADEHFYVNIVKDSFYFSSIVILRNELLKKFFPELNITYSSNFMVIQAPDKTDMSISEGPLDNSTIIKRIKALNEIWKQGYSYGSTVFLDTKTNSYPINMNNCKKSDLDDQIDDLRRLFKHAKTGVDRMYIRKTISRFGIDKEFLDHIYKFS